MVRYSAKLSTVVFTCSFEKNVDNIKERATMVGMGVGAECLYGRCASKIAVPDNVITMLETIKSPHSGNEFLKPKLRLNKSPTRARLITEEGST